MPWDHLIHVSFDVDAHNCLANVKILSWELDLVSGPIRDDRYCYLERSRVHVLLAFSLD